MAQSLAMESGSGEYEKTLPNILIVDDKRENHRAIENVLSNLSANIFNARSGEGALSLTLRHRFAVVLLDVMMPEMDGYETANLMRINADTKHTPIIFITAADRDEAYENRGYEVGAVDYLFKPIKPHTLRSKVQVFLSLDSQKSVLGKMLLDVENLRRRNQLLLRSVGEGLLGLDRSGIVTFSNPAAAKILNYEKNNLEAMQIMDILYVGSSDQAQVDWGETELYKACISGETYHDTLAVFWDDKKELIPVELTATPIKDDNEFVGIVVAFQDITERKQTEERLAHLAQYDALTGLLNRSAFIKQAEQSISRARRNRQSIALLFLDLDRFKQVNDNLGHEVGDYLLTEAASRLKNCIRNGDILSRLGGDEFTVILESVISNRTVAIVAEKVIKALSEPFIVKENEIFIGASIGIAKFPESAYDAEALLRCADIAMYKVKKMERNNYRFFTYEMQKEVMEELELENQLRCAADKDQFSVRYQIKCCPYEKKVVGIEALLRWYPEKTKPVQPSVFIPKAEEMGLILPIGRWVLQTVAEQISIWLEKGLIDSSFPVSVNLSMKQLMADDLLDDIKQILADTGIPATCLELEVTESIMMEEPVSTIEILNHLHALGIKISIDDFGTGYSSLNYLRQMPLDTLKIDRSFIQEIGISLQNETIIKAITALSHNLELKVVAEGVENTKQLDFLKRHECDFIQGYYFGKPVTADEMTKVLKKSCLS